MWPILTQMVVEILCLPEPFLVDVHLDELVKGIEGQLMRLLAVFPRGLRLCSRRSHRSSILALGL